MTSVCKPTKDHIVINSDEAIQTDHAAETSLSTDVVSSRVTLHAIASSVSTAFESHRQ